MVLNLIASKVIQDWENICKEPVEDYGHLWRLMVISITVNYPYLTTNIPSPIWLRICLLQKLLVFAVYQKLADSVGHCFFRYRCWLLGHTCTELLAENLTLYCLPCPHLKPLFSKVASYGGITTLVLQGVIVV